MRVAVPLLLGLLAPALLPAQGGRAQGYLLSEPPVTLTVYGGVSLPGASGDIWGFTFDELTLARRDFAAFDRGVDIAFRLSPRTDLVLGWAVNGRTSRSEFRDWVDQDDLPIEQETRFERRPLSASLRYSLVPRGQRIGTIAWIPASFVPWVGAGAGTMSYQFVQAGDWVDSETSDVFTDRFTAKGRSSFLQASAGAGWTLSPNFVLTGEVRYLHSGASGRPSFEGFDRLDLSGFSTTLGLTLRFSKE
ncbi:MAG: hypothetical protein KF689_06810 [Gemmatimonadaceae bacterium]|nr:hypothetical protein [Gemmatimonadaceae bacterium]MCW5825115.1 hypothetical protein [Gemmatimonadaceae bacterium]